jgi:hypothetical protein
METSRKKTNRKWHRDLAHGISEAVREVRVEGGEHSWGLEDPRGNQREQERVLKWSPEQNVVARL